MIDRGPTGEGGAGEFGLGGLAGGRVFDPGRGSGCPGVGRTGAGVYREMAQGISLPPAGCFDPALQGRPAEPTLVTESGIRGSLESGAASRWTAYRPGSLRAGGGEAQAAAL